MTLLLHNTTTRVPDVVVLIQIKNTYLEKVIGEVILKGKKTKNILYTIERFNSSSKMLLQSI